MTFAIGHVDGGTNAGRKKPMGDKPQAWTCECFAGGIDFTLEIPDLLRKLRPGYLTRCPDCGERRGFAEASVAAEQLYA